MAASSNFSPGAGPFRATQIWNTLVQHLEENAHIKKRRNTKKCYEDCFTGSNAVDVLFQYVRLHPEQFPNAPSILRENIIRLCQSFLENGIFEQAGLTKNSEKHDKFIDSTASFYQFTNESRLGAGYDKSASERRVLQQIDGDIRNSFGHIKISHLEQNLKQESSTKSKNFIIPRSKQGSHSKFPSFSGWSAQSYKERHLTSNSAHPNDSDELLVSTLKRSGRPVKRSASFGPMENKLSTANRKSSSNIMCSDTGNEDDKDKPSEKVNHGGKMRLSRRLSLRKKSISSSEDMQLSDTNSADYDKLTTLPPICKRNWLEKRREPSKVNGENSQLINRFDPNRRSLGVTRECTKPRRSLRRMLSSSLLPQHAGHYDISKAVRNISQSPRKQTVLPHPVLRVRILKIPENHFSLENHELECPAKMPKRDSIKETPRRSRSSNFKSMYKGSLNGFAQRMSKEMSLRREEYNFTASDTSCVVKNRVTKSDLVCDTNSAQDPSQRKLTMRELSHLRRECVRVRLLQILDLPFIDSLITSPNSDKKDADGVFVDTCSSCGVNYSEVVTAYNSEDSWFSSALSVLQHLPNGYKILCKHARKKCHTKKLQLFFEISDYYKSLCKPLVGDNMIDIVDAIAQMLATKPAEESLEAMQLFLHLLPDCKLYELRDLFSFLHCVVTSTSISLTPQCNNQTMVMKDFSVIFPRRKVNQLDEQSKIFGVMLFIIKYHRQVFALPAAVTVTMASKRKLMEMGEVDSPSLVTDLTFCAPISSKEYEKQRVESTQAQVSKLAQLLRDDITIPVRKKKDLMKKLQTAHPTIYEDTHCLFKAVHAASSPVPTQLNPSYLPSSAPVGRRDRLRKNYV